MKEKTQKGGEGRQSEADGEKGVTYCSTVGLYLTALGAFEIYSVWSPALNADIKIITAVC